MPRWQRAYLVATCAVIGAAFAYAAASWGTWPTLRYFPLAERVGFAGDGIAMAYGGLVLWGLGGAACGALVGVGLARAVPRAWSTTALRLFGGWALTALVLAGAYYTWTLLI